MGFIGRADWSLRHRFLSIISPGESTIAANEGSAYLDLGASWSVLTFPRRKGDKAATAAKRLHVLKLLALAGMAIVCPFPKRVLLLRLSQR